MNDAEEKPNIMLLGLGNGDENSVLMHLFPSAASQFFMASEWAKGHPKEEHVNVELHSSGDGDMVLTLKIHRNVLLSMVAEAQRKADGITLQ